MEEKPCDFKFSKDTCIQEALIGGVFLHFGGGFAESLLNAL